MAEKIAILVAVLVICLCSTVYVMGSEITKSGGSASSKVILNTEPLLLSCKLPANCKEYNLENMSNFPVLLESIEITVNGTSKIIPVNEQIDAKSSIDVRQYLALVCETEDDFFEISCNVSV